MTTTSNHEHNLETEVLPDGRIRLVGETNAFTVPEVEALHARLDEARQFGSRRAMTDGLRALADWMDLNPSAYIGFALDKRTDVGPAYLTDEEIDDWAVPLGITPERENDGTYIRTNAWLEFGGGVRYGYSSIRKAKQDAEVSS